MVEGVTFALQVPLPVPVVVEPSLSVSVQAPVAIMVPEIFVRLPKQIELAGLVIAATGRALIMTASEPVKSLAMEVQLASLSELMV